MPPLIQGNNQQPHKLDYRSVDYKYKYPLGLRLKPGSKLHDALVKELLSRAQSSASMMTTRFSAWKKLDQTMTAYIEIDNDEKKVKNDDNRKPVSIVFPYSYVILETMLAYMSAVLSPNLLSFVMKALVLRIPSELFSLKCGNNGPLR